MTAERIGTTAELEVNKAHRVVLSGVPIVVVKDAAGVVYAIGDTCTHGDISLAEGFVEDADTTRRRRSPPRRARGRRSAPP